jgi:hypothetical protein
MILGEKKIFDFKIQRVPPLRFLKKNIFLFTIKNTILVDSTKKKKNHRFFLF